MKHVLLFFCVAISLAGCANTLDGAGRDIERAGEKIQNTF